MARRKLPFGLPFEMPFGFFAERMVQEASFRKDVKLIAELDSEKFGSLSRELKEFSSFLDAGKVSEIVFDTVGKSATDLVAVILQLSNLIRGSQERPEAAFEILCQQIAKFPDGLGDIEALSSRLKGLLIEPRGFSRQKKAEELAEATGEELKGAHIICDIRPVFDESRKEVCGAFVAIILRMELIDLDGKEISVECRITESQLDSLSKTAELAKGKISTLKNLLDIKSIPRPQIGDPVRKPQ